MKNLEPELTIGDVVEAFTETVAKIVTRFEIIEARLNKIEEVVNANTVD